jgi:serine/threonine protein kinase
MVVPEPPSAPPVAGTSALAGSSDDRQVSLGPDQAAPTMTLPDGGSEEDVQMILKDAAEAPGRYIEQVVIGRGGMGEVVLCVDRNIRRQVALKRILPHAANDPSRRARFVEEAQVTGQLEHPNIVPVHELERTPDGTIYFTMKLVKGKSLAEVLKEMKNVGKPPSEEGGFPHPPSPKTSASVPQKSLERGAGSNLSSERFSPHLSLSELLEVFLKVCDGVAYAHSRGVIHRDLKPANIMVGDFGEVLVMDWGLAKVRGREDHVDGVGAGPRAHPSDVGAGPRARAAPERGQARGPAPTPSSQDRIVSDRQEMSAMQTIAGSAMGTPAYMAPEQAEGKLDRIDARSDIYSLGALLYEILTLERAIQGENQWQVLANVLNGRIVPPEKRAPNRQPPRELSAIAMKCLSKNRARRYRSVMDLREDIGLFLEGRSVSARPDTFGQAVVKLVKRNKGISVAIAAAAVVLLAVGVFSYVRIVSALDRAVVGEAKAKINEQAAVAAQQQQRATALSASERFAKQAALAAENYRWAEAEQRLGDAQAVCPDGPWATYAKGRFAQIKGDHDTAIRLLNEALKIAPGQREIVSVRDKSVSLLHRIAEARKAMKEGGKLASWQVAEKLGDTFSEIENWREAAKAYEQALQLLPPNVARGDLEDKLAGARAWTACQGFDQIIRNLPAQEQLNLVLRKLTEIHGVAISAAQNGAQDDRLSFLSFGWLPLRHIQPLRGLSLRTLHFGALQGPGVTDLRPLRGMPLKELDLGCPKVADLSPLRGMALEKLGLGYTAVRDLGPLQGLPLTRLDCGHTAVCDLGPLQGMPLVSLSLSYAGSVSDLSPLRGMPLRELIINETRVSDLSPLQGMPLEFLNASYCGGLRNILPLKGMPLKKLWIPGTPVSDLSPLAGMSILELSIPDSVTDLTPLQGMSIQRIEFTPKSIVKGMGVLRSMRSLTSLGEIRAASIGFQGSPADFWKKYDAGEFNK